MRIVMVNNERQSFSGRIVPWEGNEISFTSRGFEDVVSGLMDSGRGVSIDRAALDTLVAESQLADAVHCESPEALLLWYVFRGRRLKRVPFIIEDEDVLQRVTALAAWISAAYGEDVLDEFISDGANVWLHHNRAHRAAFLKAGLRPGRLFHLPCSSYLISLVDPDIYSRIRQCTADGGARRGGAAVLCPGANRRDYTTFVRAMDELKVNARVLGYREKNQAPNSPFVKWRGFVPINKFIDGLASAKVIVVPLEDSGLSGGENTVTFSMALGKPVVATRNAATEELIIDGKTGLLVPPGNVVALGAAVKMLLDEPEYAEEMGRFARKAENKISRKSRDVLLKAASLVSGGVARRAI